MPLLEIDQEIKGTYVVERLLGEGAFAEVYRVRHRFLGRQAMKVFKQFGMTLAEIEDLLGEPALLSRMGHPNIVRVFDANTFEAGGRALGYFTMEYVSGGSLEHYWRSYRQRLMPVTEAVEIMRQVCDGLAVAHREEPPIVHRDLKPQNVLVGYDGNGLRVRVSDFGLAKRVNPLTLLASARGTFGFKPPESLDNMDSPAADVWALGTTLYLLLTDVLPYPCNADTDVLDSARFLRPVRPPSVYNIQVDHALDAVLSRCLANKPADRYRDAGELLDDLRRWKPRGLSESLPLSDSAESTTSKSALGEHTIPNPRDVARTVAEAMRLAEDPGKLVMAADLMEEAIAQDADLRSRYESRLKLWRRGVCM
ncbi:MAG: serine/threonine protein kinase [Planctomycetes bacterium]|nr:serine/threonine protein kinase [Planctomycetota bacterium]